jgi:hypothetical protein
VARAELGTSSRGAAAPFRTEAKNLARIGIPVNPGDEVDVKAVGLAAFTQADDMWADACASNRAISSLSWLTSFLSERLVSSRA